MTISPPLVSDPGDWDMAWDDLPAPPAVTDEAEQDALLSAAIASIWHLTGERLGRHTTTLRPCLTCGCASPGHCGCRYYDSIDLDSSGGERPVRSVASVSVLGNALDGATDYGVVNNRWLVRTPTGQRWPACQDIAADPAPLELTWTWGLDPSDDLRLNAVAPLVGLLWRAWNHQPCSLNPNSIQAVQREGISFALVSPGNVWQGGYTGDAAIDAACVRAWPLGSRIRISPGFFDPADDEPEFVRFERA